MIFRKKLLFFSIFFYLNQLFSAQSSNEAVQYHHTHLHKYKLSLLAAQIEAIKDLLTLVNTQVAGIHVWKSGKIQFDTSLSQGHQDRIEGQIEAYYLLFFLTLTSLDLEVKLKDHILEVTKFSQEPLSQPTLLYWKLNAYEQALAKKNIKLDEHEYAKNILFFKDKLQEKLQSISYNHEPVYSFYHKELQECVQELTTKTNLLIRPTNDNVTQ